MEPVVANGRTGLVHRPSPAAKHERHHCRRHKRILTPSPIPRKKTTKAFLSSIRELTSTHTQSYTNLKQAPDGSYILTHPKKDTSTLNTNFVVSLSDPSAYAMLATLTDIIKIPLPINTTTRGQIRQQITNLNLTPHTRSILGRTYP